MRDVLIIGAGSAGSVLAERLSSDPGCNVTVVEAGPAPSDPRVEAQITDGLRLPIGAASSVVRHYASVLTENPPRHTEIIRGSVVGGSGAVNGGYFCRGLPTDFETWAVPGWGWQDVLPHFRAIETDLDFDTPLHGDSGPITVRRVREFDGCTASFVDAATRSGFGWIDDLNGSDAGAVLPAGVGAVPLNINGRNRVGPGGAYLKPALERPNLEVLTDTRVHQVLFRANRAVGVRCDDGAVLRADRIVLCSGAIGSAHLLLLSGVGPAADLEALDVEVVAGLPVGMHTVDHPEWVLPVSWVPTHDLPPLEAVLTTAEGIEVRPYTAGFAAMVHGPEHDPAELPHLGVALMRPHSRGRVRLASADPAVAPVIEHRYDSVAEDVDALRRGAELARELVSHTAEVGDAFWSTSQHLAGTAPMGTGPDAVLDPTCRVLGVEGLWVVDGSIMPAITSRGPHATIAMIGRRAAEFLST
ncbi:mycofactocin system GMC family oxidoreductase MftG [Mycolicibacterium septicum DSM 44393]|uniref:Mycofactocin system GMC family oxidoreductase MftG n=1 Tax=Mycolicibacterium septicum DSM 44393 TaxID=1341646 RepID=A0A7X6MV41_9MYCO|nr:mycofactocin system GMC family oxidoreductase MftG [Mycolicibacterium septicum]NKZ14598.1 mycofactocin system GMC family oxidoreductase MftG [Mycolicibacterium septicum DSM 44393]